MAKITDAQYIVTACGANVPEKSIESIAKKTQNEFDVDWVLTELALIEKPTAKDIIRIINKAKPTPKAHCGACKKGFIYALNRYTFRDMEANDVAITVPILLPKAMCYCPNCGKTPGSLQKSLSYMNPTMVGWQWVILYDFAIYHLQHSIAPNDFNPTELWASLEIFPELTQQQMNVMNEIWQYAQSRAQIQTPDLNPLIQKNIRGIA